MASGDYNFSCDNGTIMNLLGRNSNECYCKPTVTSIERVFTPLAAGYLSCSFPYCWGAKISLRLSVYLLHATNTCKMWCLDFNGAVLYFSNTKLRGIGCGI